ncbi:LLM class flavin-dependent oxidoreductase [Geobacillus vulcani]|uniref:LLM class flavin-dependent oxidoreductase n=1 Tax=Geobacillus vulcani TaxID=135517 RepID=UPI0004DF03CC|nr:LLM class flavin-dependent oxidoreductase [Geobacillus vulcani]
MSVRQMKFGLFLMGVGHHIAAWRHPDVRPEWCEDFTFFRRIAEIAEQGKLDMLFVSDGLAIEPLSHPAEIVRLEPFTLLAALAAVTHRIGLAGTASTTYNEPFHIARKFSSLDHISRGRAAWNIVTSYYEEEAYNFSQTAHLEHRLRYERAREFVDVVNGLWESWDEEALIRDQSSGIYFHAEKWRPLNHHGTHFSVRGPLNSSRPPQGKPVLIQAGSSQDGIRFAAHVAEVVFTAQSTLTDAQRFYQTVKQEAARAGRNPDHMLIMPGVAPYIGRTEQEAREQYEQLQELIVPEVGLAFLSDYLGGIDFSGYSLDDPLPDDIPETNGNQSRRQLIIDLARRERLTIRQLYQRIAGARGHFTIIGTPEQVADQLEYWFLQGAADGFNLMFPYYPNGLQPFVEHVIPILQKRGLFRRDYEGTTLRDHLGLPVPKSIRV